MEKRKQLIICIIIYIFYVSIILLANIFMRQSELNNNKTYEMISGILFGFIGIPIFSIIIPIWLAKKWGLDFSFWPKTKNIFIILAILIIYILLANFESIKVIIQSGISIKDFMIHYVSTLLFHVTYYPLFVLFIFPVIRKNYGLISGLIFTSLAFSLYHLAQFYFFPCGTTPLFLFFLFISFIISLLFYLWSESLILVSLVHNTNGAIALIANGTIFNKVDFVFYLTIVIIGFLFSYMIYQEIKDRKNKPLDKEWWLNISIKK